MKDDMRIGDTRVQTITITLKGLRFDCDGDLLNGMGIEDHMSTSIGEQTTTKGPKIICSGEGVAFEPTDGNVPVARIIPLGSPARWRPMETPTRQQVALTDGHLKAEIHEGGLTFVENVSDRVIDYIYWLDPDYKTYYRTMGAHMLGANDDGGCLHLGVPGHRIKFKRLNNGMLVTLKPGQVTAVSAFPLKAADWSKLYGEDARPHCYFVPNDDVDGLARDVSYLTGLRQRGFGVVILHHGVYPGAEQGAVPSEIGSLGVPAYQFRNPARMQEFIAACHGYGFKVLSYMQAPHWQRFPLDAVRQWMRDFQAKWELQGWLFDPNIIGDWLRTYNLARGVREDVGPDGLMYDHCSLDAVGNQKGIFASFIRAYYDYTLGGEYGDFAVLDNMSNPFVRYYLRGFDGCMWNIKVHNQSDGKLTFSEAMRHVGSTVGGSCRLKRPESWDDQPPWLATWQHKNKAGDWIRERIDWDADFLPGFKKNQAAFKRGEVKG